MLHAAVSHDACRILGFFSTKTDFFPVFFLNLGEGAAGKTERQLSALVAEGSPSTGIRAPVEDASTLH